jgi:hypothetical protein
MQLFFKIDEEMKTFQQKHKLKQFMTRKPELQRMLNGNLCTDEKERQSQK